ncbi:DNA helicase [Balamuthia mandrillaris]
MEEERKKLVLRLSLSKKTTVEEAVTMQATTTAQDQQQQQPQPPQERKQKRRTKEKKRRKREQAAAGEDGKASSSSSSSESSSEGEEEESSSSSAARKRRHRHKKKHKKHGKSKEQDKEKEKGKATAATPAELLGEVDENDVERIVIVPKAAREAELEEKALQEDEEIRSLRGNDQALAQFNLFGQRCFAGMELKEDHASRPIWVCPDHHIFLETYSPIYQQAYDFLIAISEPVCRPPFMHEYRLTPYSLYAAVSVGLESEDIIKVLDRLSKVRLPESIKRFIRSCTLSYGKVKLVLQHNKYFVESRYPDILQRLLKDTVIAKARVKPSSSSGAGSSTQGDGLITSVAPQAFKIPGGTGTLDNKSLLKDSSASSSSSALNQPLMRGGEEDDLARKLNDADEDEDQVDSVQHTLHSFEIDNSQVEFVKRRCIELDYPMLEEYDFRNDTHNPNVPIDLKPTTQIRPYQEKSLSKMFGDGRARSGIIVLPCGAGKSLVGVTATSTVKKSTIVLCTSSVSVEQWRHQFKLWSNVEDRYLTRFTSEQKDKFNPDEPGIVITTYTMIAFGGKRSKDSEKIMRQLREREWGLLVLDEVHVVPAKMFRKVIYVTAAHCKLGLTATLLREDSSIDDLNFLIGPKLYEANWMDLQRAGHLANVQCAEVWCTMPPEFFREYIKASPRKRKMLYVMNPNKFRATQFLIQYHEARGDKIIVFSDNVLALQTYARRLGKPYIYGPTSGTERMRVFSQFQYNPALKTIFVSKVGDTSIDLPAANVIIQISSHFGSRRQEAQRLGRILRPKARTDNVEFNAFFYSIVSKDTQEMYYSTKRQQFLIDQGYSFKVISDLPMDDSDNLCFSSKQEQLELLQQVLAESDEAAADEMEEADEDSDEDEKALLAASRPAARRVVGSMKNLSGGDSLQYLEYKKGERSSSSGVYARPQVRHNLFKKRYTKPANK